MEDRKPGSKAWHDQVVEEIIYPERPIIDTHHHLWQRADGQIYVLPDLWEDTGSGHNIEKTIFIECRTNYRTEGPEHLYSIGETEFVTGIALESAKGGKGRSRIAGIVAHADLRLGNRVEEIIQAHTEAAQGLFRGIRQSGARFETTDVISIRGQAPKGLYADKDFRHGMRLLGRLGLTYDTWHYHYQNQDFAALALAVPDTIMILDHFGTPLGVGPYKDKRQEIFKEWKKDIAEISRCDNVIAKLGGLAMPDNGFGWDTREVPPSSDEFIAAQKAYYLHTIECFGVDRCMFESNFPVDKRSISYAVLWNAFKKMVADFSADEKQALFYGTAARVYRI